MKKIFTILVMAFCAFTLQAQSLKYKSGNPAIFKNDFSFNVVINDTNPIIDGKNQLAKDYYTAKSEQEYVNFVIALERAHQSFITYYNEKKGSIQSKIIHSTDAPYTLKIDVSSMNVGNGGGMAFGMTAKAGGALINGTMILVDNSTGDVLCEMEFSRIKGLMAPKFTARAISVYRYLADEVIKSVN